MKEIFKLSTKEALFLGFAFIYAFVGVLIFYFSSDILTVNNDILFGADNARVYHDILLKESHFSHYRVAAHPFILLYLQPLANFIRFLVQSGPLSVIFLCALTGGGLSAFLYLMAEKLTENSSLSLLLTLIFGFSFSSIFFSSIPESYIFGAFFNILLLCFVLNFSKSKSAFSFKTLFPLALLSLASFGMVFINLISVAVIVSYFFISAEKEKTEKRRAVIKFLSISTCLCVFWLFLQEAWGAKNFISYFLWSKSPDFAEYRFLDFGFGVKKILVFIYQALVVPFFALNFKVQPAAVFVPKFYPLWILPVAFVFYPFFRFFFNKENFNKRNSLTLFLLLLFAFNLIMPFFYTPYEAFLYSQNFLVWFILFSAFALNPLKNFEKFFLKLFLFSEIVFSLLAVVKIFNYLTDFSFDKILFAGLVSFAFVALTAFLLYLMKRIKFKDYVFNIILFYFAVIVFYSLKVFFIN